jgi:glyoxylase-like metal-dependent hydrolase (beta-lactamase superfamily II)
VKLTFKVLGSLVLAVIAGMPLMLQAREMPQYQIEQMKDNVYRFTAGHYRSAFMVTQDGIFVTDPINEDAARYLKDALAERFDASIRYMAYSHNHVDHVMGGQVIDNDTVTVIAHDYAAEDLKWTQVPTAMPELTFRDDLRVNLGDSWVELRYHGSNNGRGSVSMRFMPANVLYVVDWIVLGRMPYKDLPGYDIHGMIRSTREVLDEPSFDLFIGGHAKSGSREDVKAYLGYLEALYGKVRDGMLEGKDLATLQDEIRLPEYADLPMYDQWLSLNVAGVYRTLVDVSYFNFRSDL